MIEISAAIPTIYFFWFVNVIEEFFLEATNICYVVSEVCQAKSKKEAARYSVVAKP